MTALFTLPENLKRFKGVDFDIVHGRVLRTEMWTEQNVSGGGNTVHMGGHMSVQKGISTTNTSFKRFWIERPDGRQSDFVMNADRAPVIEDQLVTVVIGRKGNAENPVGLINYTADQAYMACDAAVLKNTAVEIFLALSFFVALLGGIILFAGAPGGFLLIAPFAIVGFRYYKKRKAYEKFVDEIITEVSKNTNYEQMKSVLLKAA